MRKLFSYLQFFYFACFILITSIQNVFALDPHKTINQYGHSVWSRQNGLPVNEVNTVLQTHDGYIWLGTTAGLLRFDGSRFEWIRIDPEDIKNQETITALYESRDSSLWIGTANDYVYRLKDGKIFHHSESDSILSRNINTFFESRSGFIWIGTSFGLYKYSGGKFTSIPIDSKYITSIAEDAWGRLWVGTHAGVRICEDNYKFNPLRITVGEKNQTILAIRADHLGNIWIGTYNGLIRWKNNALTAYAVSDGLSDSIVTSIFEDREYNLWVGTNSGGINRLSGNHWSSMIDVDDYKSRILAIAEDREGSVWVCTSNGLNQFRDVSIIPYTSLEGLANDNISSALEMADGTLYFLSEKGASVTRLLNGKPFKFNVPVGPAVIANDGSLWIGQNGILSQIKGNQLKQYNSQNGIPAKWISAITEDENGIIFYADKVGFLRFTDGRIKPYYLKNDQQYPSDNYVLCFLPQRNILWVGSTGGLARIRDGIITNYTIKDGLAGNWVSSIFDDQRGSIWISSPQSGLTRYKDGIFIAYSTKNGLFNDEIYCVLADDKGDIWLSSPRGIGYIHRIDFDNYELGRDKFIHPKIYTTAEGMKTDECFGGWQPAGWKANDGHLWFATKKGAVMIDPESFKKNEIAPPVYIEKVVIDQNEYIVNQPAVFSPGKEKYEFHYTGLSYLVPEKVQFKYILEGYDKDYINAGTRRTAYYTNLPPGKYIFKVTACNNDGIWSEVKSGFTFELKPYFYQTYWFYGLIFIAACSIIFGVYRIRVMQLLKREKDLHDRVQEAIANIKTLSGFIPICSNCKKIRDDRGYWDNLEKYFHSHSETEFAESVCPDCIERIKKESAGAAGKI